MIQQDIVFIKNIWGRLCKDTFSAQKLIAQIRVDGGFELSDISDDNILQIVDGHFGGDWHEIAFSFSELLAFYAAFSKVNRIADPRQVVGWILAAFIIRDAIENNATDLVLQINLFMDGFFAMRNVLDNEERIIVIAFFFRNIINYQTLNKEFTILADK